MLITCDESIKYKHKIVGSISIPINDFLEYEDFFNHQRVKQKVFGEIKWDKVRENGNYFDFYFTMTKKLFSNNNVRFHSNSYSNNKYTATYALVRSISWKLSNMDNNQDIGVLFDYDSEEGKNETNLSRDILNKDRHIKQKFKFCTLIDSKIFNILQITDVLTGCVAYKKNIEEIEAKEETNKVKLNFIEKVENEIDSSQSCIGLTVGLWKYDCEKKLQHYDLGPYAMGKYLQPF